LNEKSSIFTQPKTNTTNQTTFRQPTKRVSYFAAQSI